ncbi:ABC transporter permease subunit [Sorlinia euscelidii]
MSFSLLAWAPRQTAPLASENAVPMDAEGLEVFSAFLVTLLRMVMALLISLPVSFILTSLARRRHVPGVTLSALLDLLRCAPFIGLIAVFAFINYDLAIILATATSFAVQVGYVSRLSAAETPPALIELCRALGLTRWQMFWRCKAPILTPGIIVALGAAMPLAWLTLVGGEFILSSRESHVISLGLGSLLRNGFEEGRASIWIGALVATAILVLGFEWMVINPARHWSQRFRLQAAMLAEESRFYSFFHRRLASSLFLKFLHRQALSLANRRLRHTRVAQHHDPTHQSAPPARAKLLPAILIVICGLIIGYDREIFLSFHIRLEILASLAETAFIVLLASAIALAIWLPLSVLMRRRVAAQRPVPRFLKFWMIFPTFLLFPFLTDLLPAYDFPPLTLTLLLVFLSIQAGVAVRCFEAFQQFPTDLLEVARNLNVRGILWWRKVFLPCVTPSMRQNLAHSVVMGWHNALLAELVVALLTPARAPALGGDLIQAVTRGDVAETLMLFMLVTATAWLCVRLIEQDPSEAT